MINTKFEVYKIKRELKKSGKSFVVCVDNKNAFGSPVDGEPKVIGTFTGIYHEENGYISVSTGETTQTRSKKTPMILCLWEDISVLNFEAGTFIMINNKKYNITGIVNIQNWSLIADVSLELVDNGVYI